MTNKKIVIATMVVAMHLITACVSTTTGRVQPKLDDGEAAESNYNLGRQYFLRGNYNRARDALNRSLEYDPRKAKTHMTLGLTYEQLDVPRLAKEHYELAVRSEPRNIDVGNTYAVFLCRRGEHDEGTRQFERVAEMPVNDNAEIALTNAGVCMSSKPDVTAAEGFFRRALDARSNHPEALLQLALLKKTAGDFLPARAFLERYLGTQPPSPQILSIAMQIEQGMGDERAEREYRDRLLEEYPESAEARSVISAAADAR